MSKSGSSIQYGRSRPSGTSTSRRRNGVSWSIRSRISCFIDATELLHGPMVRGSEWFVERHLRELGDGCFAYLQGEGGWGWSNAGLIAGDGASLLVDTLFDLDLTSELLRRLGPMTTSAPIRT